MKYQDFLSQLMEKFPNNLRLREEDWLPLKDRGLFLESKFPAGVGTQTDLCGYTQRYSHPIAEPTDLERYEIIELVLMHFCPRISYLQARKLFRDICESYTDWESDGYTSSSYLYVRVNVKDLHKYLSNQELF
jgi:hypothetical protein